MITIVAKRIVKADKIAEFIAMVEPLINESRKENGCISYSLFQDINNANILTFIEEWESEEAIKLHNSSTHFTTIVPKLADYREAPPEVTLYKLAK